MAKKRSNWRKEKARDATPKERAYRAALNRYNRKHGTYGNGDGKDASHKGGKIAGFESASSNRARKPKRWKGNRKKK